MKTIYSKKDKLDEIRQELQDGNPVGVVNNFETCYGFGFERWLMDGLKDIACSIKAITYSRFGYARYYIITPNN